MKRAEFKRMLVRQGEWQEGGVKQVAHERWRRELLTPLEVKKWKTPAKCVNDFLIGGDPEFVIQVNGTVRVAQDTLVPGLAFGADQNGRLGEIRLAPSRAAMDLVAGMFKTLKWLKVYEAYMGFGGVRLYSMPLVHFPSLERYDGCGGHVHFGRKSSREQREREVEALDWLFGLLIRAGVWTKKDTEGRVARARYGTYGDTRIQKHGFEYRAFPSWMESPWKMFLVLTLAKLTVHDPSLPEWGIGSDPQRKIDLFLGYYQGRDDDARLARVVLRRLGLPKEGYRENFGEWGLGGRLPGDLIAPMPSYWPQVFKVEEADRVSMFEWFIKGTQLGMVIPVPDWTPTKLPKEFQELANFTTVWRITGLGDLCTGLVGWRDMPISLRAYDEPGMVILVGREVSKKLSKGWVEEFRKLGFEGVEQERGVDVYFSRGIRQNPFMIEKAKRLLTSGMFPIWRAEDAEPSKLEKWRAQEIGIKGIKLVEV